MNELFESGLRHHTKLFSSLLTSTLVHKNSKLSKYLTWLDLFTCTQFLEHIPTDDGITDVLTDINGRTTRPSDKPFKITDGQGMYLLINPNSSTYWRLQPLQRPLTYHCTDFGRGSKNRNSQKVRVAKAGMLATPAPGLKIHFPPWNYSLRESHMSFALFIPDGCFMIFYNDTIYLLYMYPPIFIGGIYKEKMYYYRL